jgi:hypothetical protein
MVYLIIFLGDDRPDDTLWFSKPPQVGDVLKIGMFASEFEELEYWTIVEILDTTVKVKQ